MKRVTTVLLAALLLLGAAPMAQAMPPEGGASKDIAGANAAGDAVAADIPEVESNVVRIWGTIDKVEEENNRILVILGGPVEGSVWLNIGEDTRIVDNNGGKALKIGDLREMETVYAWHSLASTMSIPPQTNAYVIVANIAMGQGAGQYYEVEKMEKTTDGYRLLNQQQDLYFTIPANAKLKVYNSNRTARPSTIKPGTKLVVWYDVVAESFPAQAGGANVLVLPYDYDGYVSVEGEKIIVNGKKLSETAVVDEDGHTLLPLRAVARKLGMRATWDKTTGTLALRKGDMRATFTAGRETFTAGGQEVAVAAPVVKEGALYVEMNAIRFLGAYKLATPMR